MIHSDSEGEGKLDDAGTSSDEELDKKEKLKTGKKHDKTKEKKKTGNNDQSDCEEQKESNKNKEKKARDKSKEAAKDSDTVDQHKEKEGSDSGDETRTKKNKQNKRKVGVKTVIMAVGYVGYLCSRMAAVSQSLLQPGVEMIF